MIAFPSDVILTKIKFPLDGIMATPGALRALADSKQQATEFLTRHITGDWGDVCADDCQANEQSLLDGSRLLSAYRTSQGAKLWVITEAEDDHGVRTQTTIMLPDEY